jgi:hypothetical protein
MWSRVLLMAVLGGGCTTTVGEIGSCSTRPAPRGDVSAVLVPTSNQLYLYGGDQTPVGPARQLIPGLWRYSFASCARWTPLTVSADPGPRAGYAAAFDDRRHRILYVGGLSGAGQSPPPSDDVWALDSDALTFTKLTTVGTPPVARAGHAVVYDHDRDRLLVFGGDSSTVYGGGVLGDLWQLDFTGSADGRWQPLAIGSTTLAPPPLRDAAVALDEARGLMVLFGGARDGASFSAELWAYNLVSDAWLKLATAGDLPSARAGARLAWDATRRRLMLFGGPRERAAQRSGGAHRRRHGDRRHVRHGARPGRRRRQPRAARARRLRRLRRSGVAVRRRQQPRARRRLAARPDDRHRVAADSIGRDAKCARTLAPWLSNTSSR